MILRHRFFKPENNNNKSSILSVSSDPISNTKERCLGFVETAVEIQERYADGASNVGSIMIVEGRFDLEKFKMALSTLIKIHPMLLANLKYTNDRATIVINESQSNNKDLPLTIDNSVCVSPAEILGKMVDTPFQAAADFLWELKLFINQNQIGPHTFFLKTHHIVCDGISICYFMQHLLSIYNANKQYKLLPFLKSSEDLAYENTTWCRYLLSHVYAKIYDFFHCRKKTITHRYEMSADSFRDRQTNLIFSRFDSEELDDLLQACREHTTTLTALLSAALLLAKREVLGSLQVETISTPISTRPFFSPTVPRGEHLGCYISNVLLNLAINTNMPLWDIAKKYKTQLNSMLPVMNPKDFASSPWQIKLIKNSILENKTHFTYGVAISNTGNINFISQQKPSDELKFKDLYFCASKKLGDKLMQIYANTAGGNLNLCFAYPQPLLSEFNAIKMKNITLGFLHNTIKTHRAEHSLDVTDQERSKLMIL